MAILTARDSTADYQPLANPRSQAKLEQARVNPPTSMYITRLSVVRYYYCANKMYYIPPMRTLPTYYVLETELHMRSQ
jgi:hypothetical protein